MDKRMRLEAALAKFANDLAMELAPDGIRVNTVAPGQVEIEPTLHLPAGNNPLFRISIPLEAVSHTVLFLADHRTSPFTTGATLSVDAGTALEHPRAAKWRANRP